MMLASRHAGVSFGRLYFGRLSFNCLIVGVVGTTIQRVDLGPRRQRELVDGRGPWISASEDALYLAHDCNWLDVRLTRKAEGGR